MISDASLVAMISDASLVAMISDASLVAMVLISDASLVAMISDASLVAYCTSVHVFCGDRYRYSPCCLLTGVCMSVCRDVWRVWD